MVHRLLVATQNGYIYVFDIPSEEGGDCRLVVKHDLRTVEIHQPPGNFYDQFGQIHLEDYEIINSLDHNVAHVPLVPQPDIDDMLCVRDDEQIHPPLANINRPRRRYYRDEEDEYYGR